jgi:hypothetical protein
MRAGNEGHERKGLGNQPGENRNPVAGIVRRDAQRAQVVPRNFDLLKDFGVAMRKRREPRERMEPSEEEGIKVEGTRNGIACIWTKLDLALQKSRLTALMVRKSLGTAMLPAHRIWLRATLFF